MGARIKELEDEVSADLSAFLRKGNLIYSHSIYWNPEAGFLLTRTYRPMLWINYAGFARENLS